MRGCDAPDIGGGGGGGGGCSGDVMPSSVDFIICCPCACGGGGVGAPAAGRIARSDFGPLVLVGNIPSGPSDLSKMCVASSSSSQSISVASAPFAAAPVTSGAGRVEAGGGGIALALDRCGGATMGGSDPRPGGGGGAAERAEGGAAGIEDDDGADAPTGDCIPRSVRFAGSLLEPAIGARDGGGPGGCVRGPTEGGGAGGRAEAFLPRPSKISRSDPRLSPASAAMARVSCTCCRTDEPVEACRASWPGWLVGTAPLFSRTSGNVRRMY